MSTLLKKFILSFLSFLVLFFSVAPNILNVKAQSNQTEGSWYNQSFFDWYSKVYDETKSGPSEIFGERYTAAQVQWVVYGLISLPLNMDPDTQKVVACFLGTISGSADTGTCGLALIERFKKFDAYFQGLKTSQNAHPSLMANILDYKNRPISGIGYTARLIDNFSPVKSAHAQGFGYTALNPIQKYWSGFRNIAYALIVLVVVVFAFMIMFRVKLSPQLVISVQSALPKIILAIILTTFSYAISGFMIDLMYVIGGLFASLLVAAGFSNNINGIFGTYNTIFPTNRTGLYFFTHMIVYDIFFTISVILNFVASLLSASSGLPAAIFAIVGIILIVWILILSLWYTLKGTWSLVKTLISVYIAIITSPLQFTLSALVPSLSFGNWFKKIMADLLVFPVTGLLMFFAWSLMWSSYAFGVKALAAENLISQLVEQIMNWTGNDTTWFNTLWTPEILGFGEAVSGFLFLMASFSCIALIPKVPDMLKGFILGEKFSFGTAIGEAVGPAQWVWGQTGAPLVEGARRKAFEGNQVDAIKKLAAMFENMYNARFPRKGVKDSTA